MANGRYLTERQRRGSFGRRGGVDKSVLKQYREHRAAQARELEPFEEAKHSRDVALQKIKERGQTERKRLETAAKRREADVRFGLPGQRGTFQKRFEMERDLFRFEKGERGKPTPGTLSPEQQEKILSIIGAAGAVDQRRKGKRVLTPHKKVPREDFVGASPMDMLGGFFSRLFGG